MNSVIGMMIMQNKIFVPKSKVISKLFPHSDLCCHLLFLCEKGNMYIGGRIMDKEKCEVMFFLVWLICN